MYNIWDDNQKATWNRIKSLSGDELNDPDSPQYLAAHWIVQDDKWHYPANSSFLYQRYVLVLLWKMMGHDTLFVPDGRSDECQWPRVSCDPAGFVDHLELGEFSFLASFL